MQCHKHIAWRKNSDWIMEIDGCSRLYQQTIKVKLLFNCMVSFSLKLGLHHLHSFSVAIKKMMNRPLFLDYGWNIWCTKSEKFNSGSSRKVQDVTWSKDLEKILDMFLISNFKWWCFCHNFLWGKVSLDYWRSRIFGWKGPKMEKSCDVSFVTCFGDAKTMTSLKWRHIWFFISSILSLSHNLAKLRNFRSAKLKV